MRALILGVSGQDGSYLAEQLLDDGVDVVGMVRRTIPDPLKFQLLLGDLLDQESLERVLARACPDVVYNVAAVTAPGGAWGTPQPPMLADVTGLGVLRLLDAMVKVSPDARLVHASSSAIYEPHRYGLYGISKQFAHNAIAGYRGRLHCSNAVLFSHTSPRQDPRFLARRITSTVARIASGSRERLVLGDVESRRDWGYAPDYMRALPLIAQRSSPGDWVIASGRSHSVRDLTEAALAHVGLDWDQAVTVDPNAERIPSEIYPGAQEGRLATLHTLGWKAETELADMVQVMVDACRSAS